MIAGVIGGFARRFGWNSTLLRVIFVLVSVLSAAFPGILVYLIAWLLIPEEGG
jgi:phage shock protein PspC (stress-responsive transcriptional regulator)